MPDIENKPVPIYTIGYGRRSVDEVIASLRLYDIQYIVDIRTSPYSRYKPEFSKDALEYALVEAGLRYIFMGDLLGGRPDDPSCYDAAGRVDYETVKTKDFYQQGFERLRIAFEQGQRVSLLCSEGKPEECHRSKLIGVSLDDAGIPVAHIDEKDDIKTQQHVMHIVTPQPSLFNDFTTLTSRKKYAPTSDDYSEQDKQDNAFHD